jgi:pimeloyl-ACP methyl ester carboxylesterase
MNFAADIRCPTLVGLGLEDDVVPAPTVYAIANHLGGPYEVVRLPVSHTERPEEKLWGRFEAYWLRLAVKGVPPDFGERRESSI